MINTAFQAEFTKRAHDLRAQTIKKLFLETPIEIFLGAAVVSVGLAMTSYYNEAGKQGQIPLAYAEFDDLTYDYRISGDDAPALTTYYAALNNSVMQVFEANNLSYVEGRGSDEDFADALNATMRRYNDSYTQIGEHAERMPGYAEDALAIVAPFETAYEDALPIMSALDNAWEDTHRDVYHTQTYQTCNDNGCTTHTRQVYDYTIHTYRYNEAQGELAVALLRDFAAEHPDIRIDEVLLQAERTYEENMRLMRESRQDMSGYEEPTEAEYLALANVWATGSNYAALTPGIYQSHTGVINGADRWAQAEPHAEYHRYRTYTRYDSGPREFQVAESVLDYVTAMARDMGRVTGGMESAGEELPLLESQIRAYVDASINQDDDADLGAMRDEIMDTARELYAENYAGGFDVYPAKWYMVMVWAGIGLLIGGGLGFGADRLVERMEERAPKPLRRPYQQKIRSYNKPYNGPAESDPYTMS